jgi:hypothetical protein
MLKHWDCGFEIYMRYGCTSVVSVLCCPVWAEAFGGLTYHSMSPTKYLHQTKASSRCRCFGGGGGGEEEEEIVITVFQSLWTQPSLLTCCGGTMHRMGFSK